ncbi:ring-h2 finger protein atl48-like [Plasmopara halstedii]|uniref:Ring-h2 finger protein atl48-like n=1 Tax=Plasmopara halstedii TaxID=4781 RepID=A0A0P1AHB5_PLAHL|nr:ring-h2 finger protein atl48-like [Plasmopara halstedii]CEG40505.1 ring-h2 finger protein atl48-like [Plasmopara halstedii]|eukprot:XP_024576874.1 ring-h2 finger protein atl48-like [Plasmopara halstedii]
MRSDRDAVKTSRVSAVGDFGWMEDGRNGGRNSLWTRIKEDPIVPLGCTLTTAVLLGGLVTFQRGYSKLGNKFMQARVVLQASTVFALAGATALSAGEKQEQKKLKYEDRLEIKLRDE